MTAATDDAAMDELMKKWDKENQVEDVTDSDDEADDDDCLGYDDMLEKFRREVTVTNNAFDHVVLGASDLDKACDDFEEMTGIRPLMVVSHNGLGTKSARVAFQQCAFLEIVAPDPKQDINSDLVQKLAKIPSGKLQPVHYAIRNTKSKDFKNTVWSDMKLECDQVTMIAKDRGQPWKWDMFFLEEKDGGVDGMIPFFVNWGDATHSAARLPIVGSLDKVVVRGPSHSPVHKLLQGVSDIDVAQEDDDYFECSFTSSKGQHTFKGSSLIGLSFPAK